MANHSATALLLIASLLVAAALSGADARLAAVSHNARMVTVRRDGHGGYYVLEKAKAAPAPPAVPAELTCKVVHGVQKGETCFSVAEASKLKQDDFLAFNPNINCENLFVGQWVCLEATAA